MAEQSNTLSRPTAPTGHNLTQEDYWQSLDRSFNSDFIDEAVKEYDRRKRLQMD